METTVTIDTLEIEYGRAILSEACGQELTHKQQSVRLFDQTRHSAEVYFPADEKGKPYIHNFQEGKRYYPVKAFAVAHNIDFNTANVRLQEQYYGGGLPETVTVRPRLIEQPLKRSIDYLPFELYEPCQSHFDRNGLYEYLRFTYGLEAVQKAFTHYRLGTSRRWCYYGYLATCLPQFDIAGNLRQVKVIPFDAMSGRRVKRHQPAERWNAATKRFEPTEPDTDKIYFAGKHIAKQAGITKPNLKQCFFGEHLLSEYPERSVAVVEGESTAIVCSAIWPDYIWLATGGSMGGSWYSPERFSVLRGRNVTLWPDTGKYVNWSQKASVLRPLCRSLYVSDYVEKNAPEGMGNVDLRDLLTRPCYFPKGEEQPIYGEVLSCEPAPGDTPF
ncbi:DUF6371 domain-containing protein [Spirosoma sp. KNUC1025]|uniref:DUF6371 domain-containing protein n=1 Tax=Spirosoma sp. KNUC1025 TaxID=2894082 RepID=UPI00386A3E31|nr:DUF6371 domain-containing protein [Spirosoma sp. KNUC1025]